ncbi:MAG TPA: HAD family hydrolase, partial [Lachnospiraceae bacterium]|nr:HAD family hydrolase [Lachnospiraceae bacterium]
MLSNIKAAIFDVDGTLLDSNGVWHQIDIDFMKERNMSHPDNLQNWLDGLSFNQVAEFFHE